jgi:3'-phosphoadenosine 5'-phosphosulfate sulfotransferase (PAPS reductase)/FAD synthetase
VTYEQKVDGAKALVHSCLQNARNPAIMCSFGKDSIVVLHLVMSIRRLKVIFHREPFQHHKYAYANRVMRDWDLHVIDFPPVATALSEGESELEVVNYYPNGNSTVYLPTGLRQDTTGPNLVCALSEIYLKPTGTINYPFDLVFHGHKSSDSDPIVGEIKLYADIANGVGHSSAAFPIRHFTDDDVWRYIEENGLPIHEERYEKVDGRWREKQDKTYNPDYISCCYACMSKKTGNNVYCPKFKATVSNVSDKLNWAPPLNYSYLKR